MQCNALLRFSLILGLLIHAMGCVDKDAPQNEDLTPIAIERTYPFSETQDLKLSVPRPLVLNSPAWNLDDANPPLAARDAITSATDAIATLDQSVAKVNWRFEHAALFKSTASDLPGVECWFWIVAYYDANAVELQPMAQLEIVVLMDGRVVSPILVPARHYDDIEY